MEIEKEQEKNKKIRIEIDSATFWKAGTILFAILFIISLFTGGFGLNDKGTGTVKNTAQAPTVNVQGQPNQPEPVLDVKVGDAYTKGNENAKVTVIEYSDFQCPFCKRFYDQTLPQIQKDYIDTGKVLLAYKHLPLEFHENAQKAGEAAECAGKIGGDEIFWGMHNKIFDNQEAITVPDLKKYAGELGLDQATFDSCLDNGDTAQKVNAHNSEASRFGATGTPTFFINGKKIVGAQPYTAFKTVIDAEL